MAIGRRPRGDQPLSNAERQARYRARCRAQEPTVSKRPRPANGRRSRPRRWHDAVAELLALQSEYAAWLDTLPDTLPDTLHDTLHDTALAAGLQAIVDLDLDMLAATEPPRGYRRD